MVCVVFFSLFFAIFIKDVVLAEDTLITLWNLFHSLLFLRCLDGGDVEEFVQGFYW
jgi:hypothetical protein